MLRLISLVLISIQLVYSEMDQYINESWHECSSKSDMLSCTKYQTLRYLTLLGKEYGVDKNITENLPVKLVKMEDNYQENTDLFVSARQLPEDSEFTKFIKFVQRQANFYLANRGISINLPDGTQVVEDDERGFHYGRGKKKKAAMVIMPLIILFKLFKIKLMVAIVLAGVIFVKKAIMLAALVIPSLLQHLKHCSKPNYYHHQAAHHQPHHFEEYHPESEDFNNYYGGSYGKDYERAYSAHHPNKG